MRIGSIQKGFVKGNNRTGMTTIMRQQCGGRSECANGRTDLAMQGIGSTAALLLQFADVLQCQLTLSRRLRDKFRLHFGSLTSDIHHILICYFAHWSTNTRCLGSNL